MDLKNVSGVIPKVEDVELYIKELKFDVSNDYVKTMVIGNIRGFYNWLVLKNIKWERTGNILERDPEMTEEVRGFDDNGVFYEGTATIIDGCIEKVEDIDICTE